MAWVLLSLSLSLRGPSMRGGTVGFNCIFEFRRNLVSPRGVVACCRPGTEGVNRDFRHAINSLSCQGTWIEPAAGPERFPGVRDGPGLGARTVGGPAPGNLRDSGPGVQTPAIREGWVRPGGSALSRLRRASRATSRLGLRDGTLPGMPPAGADVRMHDEVGFYSIGLV